MKASTSPCLLYTSRHGKQKDRGIWPLLTVPSPSYLIMGGKSGSIDILGMITYMAWPVIMKRGCTTNQELIDAGIMFKADTIEELAEKIGYPPATLAATLKKYNDAIEAGEPDEFGRGTAVYASNLFNAVEAVSYTHLDVYKRQPTSCSCAPCATTGAYRPNRHA